MRTSEIERVRIFLSSATLDVQNLTSTVKELEGVVGPAYSSELLEAIAAADTAGQAIGKIRRKFEETLRTRVQHWTAEEIRK